MGTPLIIEANGDSGIRSNLSSQIPQQLRVTVAIQNFLKFAVCSQGPAPPQGSPKADVYRVN